MRVGMIFLGRKGSGGPVSLELACQMGQSSSVFAVISRQVENLPQWRETDLQIIETSTYRDYPSAILSWLNQPRIRRLAQEIRAEKPDVLLFPFFHTWAPFLQAYLRDIPAVLTVHDPQPHPGLFDWLDGRFLNLSIRQATRCIILSEVLRDAMISRGIPSERIDTIPHGELSYYQRLSPVNEPENTRRRVLLFFGRITPYKGLDILLQAYQQLQPMPDLILRIVGEGNLTHLQPQLKILPRVEITNHWVEETEIGKFFQDANMVILPYTHATQSGVLAIAAGFKKPVIATKTGGLPEQVQDGNTGILIPANDVSALAGAIRHLLDHPDEACRLGENLYQTHMQENNWEVIAQKTLISCQRAIDQRSEN
jgi:glycosyltransferase involved in cell wall biosynthesis